MNKELEALQTNKEQSPTVNLEQLRDEIISELNEFYKGNYDLKLEKTSDDKMWWIMDRNKPNERFWIFASCSYHIKDKTISLESDIPLSLASKIIKYFEECE